MRWATRSFHSAVRAWPSSSMHVQIDGRAVLAGQREEAVERVPGASPSSRLTELRMALPPIHCSPASMTGGSVESSTSGTLAWVAKRLAISSMSATPSSPA